MTFKQIKEGFRSEWYSVHSCYLSERDKFTRLYNSLEDDESSLFRSDIEESMNEAALNCNRAYNGMSELVNTIRVFSRVASKESECDELYSLFKYYDDIVWNEFDNVSSVRSLAHLDFY